MKIRMAWCALVGVAAALAVGGGLVHATIPSSDGVIGGCYSNETGILRVVDREAGARCRGGETALDWSDVGPPGPQGPPGDPGESALTVGVDAFGNHVTGTADVTITHPHPGKYVVTFNDPSSLSPRGTIECATVATLSRGMSGAFNSDLFDAPPGEISTFPGFGANFPLVDQVVVNTYGSAGDPVDQPFWLVLFC